MSFYHVTKTTNGNYRLKIDNKVDPMCAGNPNLDFVTMYCKVKYGVIPRINPGSGVVLRLQDEIALNIFFVEDIFNHIQSLETQLESYRRT